MTKIQLRNLWFQIHKWIGIVLAIAIIPLSLTGSALVWDQATERLLHPARYDVSGLPQRPLADYVAAARGALKPGETLMEIELPTKSGNPVEAIAARPGKGEGRRPVRTLIFLDPADAHVIERTRSDAGALRVFHVLHGSLMIPGVGRQIVGWIGVAMLISSLTGLWLWWPTVGSWLRGFRWRQTDRTDHNLHHMIGFWIAIPLAVLSFTGMWISFPQVFRTFDGAAAQRQAGPPGPPRGPVAKPLAQPKLPLETAIAYAGAVSPGGVTVVEWPTDKAGWKVTLAHDGRDSTLIVDDATGQVKAEPKRKAPPETLSRFMRRLHDGTGMPLWWQVVIFIGGIIPAILAITGIIMWLRTRTWRKQLAARRKAARAAA